MIVHVLEKGYPLCGFSSELPRDWPEGHKWTGLNDLEPATCLECRAAAARYESESN